MRKYCLIVAVVVAFGVSAVGADMVRVPLLNGIYSVEAPADWYVEQSDDGTSACFAPSKNATSRVLFSAPNPTVGGDVATYAGVQMGLFFKAMGGGEIAREEEGEFGGYPCIVAHFTFPGGQGLMNVFDVDGSAVMSVAVAADKDFDEFADIAVEIMESYEIDEEAVAENLDLLAELGEVINDAIMEQLK